MALLHGGYWRRRYGLDLMEPLAADLAQRKTEAESVGSAVREAAGTDALEESRFRVRFHCVDWEGAPAGAGRPAAIPRATSSSPTR